MKFLLALLFISSLIKSDDMDLKTIYSKLSLDSKYRASLVYDNQKEWYALAIYRVQNPSDELINISRVNQSYLSKIKLIFTTNSKHLIYVTKANNQYSVYD